MGITICSFKFNNENSNTIFNLKNVGLSLLISEDYNDLIIQLNYQNTFYYPTFVRLRDFCLYTDKDESGFDALVDNDGIEISLSSILCSDVSI